MLFLKHAKVIFSQSSPTICLLLAFSPIPQPDFAHSFINPGSVVWASKPMPHGGVKNVTEVSGFVPPYVSELK